MALRFRSIAQGIFVFINVAIAIVYLATCYAPNTDPVKWWFLHLLIFLYPALLACLIAFMVVWLFAKKKLALISLITIIIGIKSLLSFFAFHIPSDFKKEKASNNVRIASWNVARFVEMKVNNNKGSRTRLRMMEQIEEQNADVLCLQEFQTSIQPGYYNNIYEINKHLRYPYYYFIYDLDGDGHYYSSIIFSRFPIIDSGFIRMPRPSNPEILLFADIKTERDTFRIYTTHLQSLHFKKDDYDIVSRIKHADDSLLSNSKTIFSKLKTGIALRRVQADVTAKVMDDSPYPKIFCADMNDIPNSYAYETIRGDMQDAFLKKGFGVGRTFLAISPTLRIDYIFADDRFTINQFKRVKQYYSDHYMLVSDVELKK